MTEKEVAISIQELSYSYKSDWTTKRFPALKEISLEVYHGESFGFLGHNGAGKTTTIKCLLDLVKPQSGKIEIYGLPHTTPVARQSVGYLPEQPYFYDYLTVYEIMEMYGHLAGIPKGSIKQRVDEALERVRVSARKKSPMRALSKGLTQRVAMAQAIVAQPKLLVLDEPFSGLDPIGRKEFKDLLFDLKSQNTTIFVSSHILGDIEFLCDRVSIMAQGELKQVLSLDELSRFTSESYELVVSDFAEIAEQLAELATEHQTGRGLMQLTFQNQERAERALALASSSTAYVQSYQTHQGSLEDLFVKLVEFQEEQ